LSTKYYLQDSLEKISESLSFIKRICKDKDKNLYERWKAGGFLIDTNIVSMYPNIEDVVESLIEEEFEDD
jgi:hypothetical protein